MPLLITDEMLRAAGLSEQEAKIEIACRWFDEGKLSFGHAARLAGLGEIEFEYQLEHRHIPRHRCTQEMLENDVDTLKNMDQW